jgi:hypothetical protein
LPNPCPLLRRKCAPGLVASFSQCRTVLLSCSFSKSFPRLGDWAATHRRRLTLIALLSGEILLLSIAKDPPNQGSFLRRKRAFRVIVLFGQSRAVLSAYPFDRLVFLGKNRQCDKHGRQNCCHCNPFCLHLCPLSFKVHISIKTVEEWDEMLHNFGGKIRKYDENTQ